MSQRDERPALVAIAADSFVLLSSLTAVRCSAHYRGGPLKKRAYDMRKHLHTAWQGGELVVTQDDREIDRVNADEIQRVILVCRGMGDTPGDLAFAVIETATDAVVLPAESGIAGRIHFERQAFWAERNCVYWTSEQQASLPRRLRPALWILRRQQPGPMRVPRAELDPTIGQWPLEGPQTWEQRKWERIVRSRPLAQVDEQQRRRQSGK